MILGVFKRVIKNLKIFWNQDRRKEGSAQAAGL